MPLLKEEGEIKKLSLTSIVERHNFAKSQICKNFLDESKREEEIFKAADFLDIDWKLKAMVQRGNSSFRQEFTNGFSLYQQGDWDKAREFLERAKKLKEADGPSQCLLNFMRGLDWIAPEGWNGVRELTEK